LCGDFDNLTKYGRADYRCLCNERGWINSIIAETKAAFKQRMAQRKKKEKLTQIST
jgi:hypothetical protein